MKQPDDEKCPVFYLFLYSKIREKANGSKVIFTFNLMEVIGRTIPQVPKQYRYVILKEMEDYSLIQRIDQRKYKVTGGNVDSKLHKYCYPLWGIS